jgi:hypothetical protein
MNRNESLYLGLSLGPDNSDKQVSVLARNVVVGSEIQALTELSLALIGNASGQTFGGGAGISIRDVFDETRRKPLAFAADAVSVRGASAASRH